MRGFIIYMYNKSNLERLVGLISDEYMVSEDGKSIKLMMNTACRVVIIDKHYVTYNDAIEKYLRVLSAKYKIIKIIKTPTEDFDPEIVTFDTNMDISFEIEVLPIFKKFYAEFKRLKALPDDFSEDYIETKVVATEGEIITLNYSRGKGISLFGMRITKPDSFGENEAFFEYLYSHPNEEIKIVEDSTK